jgi:hypothetical protein
MHVKTTIRCVPGYLFTKHLTTKIKILFLVHTQLNATMSQIGMGVLLHEGILWFDHFAISDRRIINALQCFKNLILFVRFFVNRYPGLTIVSRCHIIWQKIIAIDDKR